jgi:hypothetical protein
MRPPPTLSEHLDEMLLGWLERHAEKRGAGRADLRATALMTVADEHVTEVERLCAKWDLSVSRRPHRRPAWTILNVSGAALPVLGLTEVAAMYRGVQS